MTKRFRILLATWCCLMSLVTGLIYYNVAVHPRYVIMIVPTHLPAPRTVLAPFRFSTGVASWYGVPFHGRITASGSRYNMYQMTMASLDLPLGAWVRVTNNRTKQSAIGMVTDRGPYWPGRSFDLSYAMAKALGFVHDGLADVTVEVL